MVTYRTRTSDTCCECRNQKPMWLKQCFPLRSHAWWELGHSMVWAWNLTFNLILSILKPVFTKFYRFDHCVYRFPDLTIFMSMTMIKTITEPITNNSESPTGTGSSRRSATMSAVSSANDPILIALFTLQLLSIWSRFHWNETDMCIWTFVF